MRTRWKWIGGITLFVFAMIAVSDLHGATTWRMPVKGNPGTGDLVYGRDANNLTSLPAVAAGSVLTSNGVNAPPVWSATPGFAKTVVSAASGTTALTAAQSGALVVNTGTSATTTFTLPAAAAGLNYCFVENGDAAGELLIGVTGTNTVVGKIHGAENGTGIATAASTGIKNTAATNVKGDMTCLVAQDTAVWVMTSVAGIWASR